MSHLHNFHREVHKVIRGIKIYRHHNILNKYHYLLFLVNNHKKEYQVPLYLIHKINKLFLHIYHNQVLQYHDKKYNLLHPKYIHLHKINSEQQINIFHKERHRQYRRCLQAQLNNILHIYRNKSKGELFFQVHIHIMYRTQGIHNVHKDIHMVHMFQYQLLVISIFAC